MPSNNVENDFTNTMSGDFFRLMCGERLGDGQSRTVYASSVDPSVVIKFEPDAKSFQNVAEWEVWSWVSSTRMQRWFAPCINISSTGCVLLQRRCEPISKRERPKQLPAFLCDLKAENFGRYKGKIVCCDYGLVLSAIRGASKRMVKARWHD